MGSRGSEYSKPTLLDLYKAADNAYDIAYGGNGTDADKNLYTELSTKLYHQGLTDDYINWLIAGKPSDWTPKAKEQQQPQEQPPEDNNWWEQQDAEKQAEDKSWQNIDNVVTRNGVQFFVNPDTGEMTPVNQAPKIETKVETQEQKTLSSEDEANPFSQGRKDNAMWTTSKSVADATLRPSAGEAWNTFTEDEKKALWSYTGSSFNSINKSLSGELVMTDKMQEKINLMSSALSRSELPVDTWLQRGIDANVANSMFKGDYTVQNIQQMINNGEIIDNKPFMSSAAAKGSGFISKPVILNIYAPKGTKAIYAEPFAMLGSGAQLKWDGKSEQKYFSHEFEVIIQRGAQLRPLKVSEKNGQIFVDVQIEGFKN